MRYQPDRDRPWRAWLLTTAKREVWRLHVKDKHVATLEFAEAGGAGSVTARVEPELLPGDDPLANIDGTTNAIVCRADPLGDVTIIGPGAGPQLAGQGVLSDLIAVARSSAPPVRLRRGQGEASAGV